jgi:L-ascorbate metabolism protein UlaG (beta-lactamase superfamily)
MKRFVLALPAALGLFVVGLPAQQAGKVPKVVADGKTHISWYGQSFFIITSSKGDRLAIDPHAIDEYGRVLGLRADGVLFSHLHNDHTQKEVLDNYKDKDFKVIPGLISKGARGVTWNNVNETFKGFKIRSVPTFHDDSEGMQHGKNTVFVIEVDGWKIVHLGDLGHRLTPAQIKKIGPMDVLMIPVGGVYTLNGSQAKDVLKQLKPKEYVLPMHYGNIRYDALLPLDEFLEDNPLPVALSKDDKLLINKDKDLKDVLRFIKGKIITTDNTLTLDRDPARPRPLLTVLHWWPQAGKKKVKKAE